MQMNPMNNPLSMLVAAAKSGGNPMAMAQQMATRDPRMRQCMQMLHGKTQQQTEQMVRNMCKERGTTPEALAQSLGFTLR